MLRTPEAQAERRMSWKSGKTEREKWKCCLFLALALGGIDCPPTQPTAIDTAWHSTAAAAFEHGSQVQSKNWQFKRKAVNLKSNIWQKYTDSR